MYRIQLILFFLLSAFVNLNAQSSYRFTADITTKVKNADSSYQYSKGSVYFDANYKKVVYKMTFPLKEVFVSSDTLLYRFVDEKLVSIVGNPIKPEYSIYYFILNNDISDFGLKKSSFRAASVEKVDDLIITKWMPPPGALSFFGNILVSTKNKRLNSVLIYNKKGILINRQIYKNYQSVKGIEIPTEILSVTYSDKLRMYQIIQFNNVVINEAGKDAIYNHTISKN